MKNTLIIFFLFLSISNFVSAQKMEIFDSNDSIFLKNIEKNLDLFERNNVAYDLEIFYLSPFYMNEPSRKMSSKLRVKRLSEQIKIGIQVINRISNKIDFEKREKIIISNINVPCYRGELPLITIDGPQPQLIENTECRELFLKKFEEREKNDKYVKFQAHVKDINSSLIDHLVSMLVRRNIKSQKDIEIYLNPIIELNLDSEPKKVLFRTMLNELFELDNQNKN